MKNSIALLLNYDGQPDCALVTLSTTEDKGATIALSDLGSTSGGALQRITLSGAGWGVLNAAEQHQTLRHCRHLLAPGGQLSLPVGGHEDEFSTEGLAEMAWLCGLSPWFHFVTGHAVLNKPMREVTSPSRVSIVIPAYKSDFFRATLESAQAQTWAHCEIVVCDDSPDGVIAEIVEQVDGPHPVRYIRNPGNIGGRANYLQCFDEVRGSYVKYLNDDDVLDPECVARMATVLDTQPEVTLVTSYRRLVDAVGEKLPDELFNAPVTPWDGLIDGRILANHVLSRGINVIGEPTTVMFRKKDMTENQTHLMSFAGQSARRNGDMSIWTSLLSRGDAVYLHDGLSDFRQHDLQVQRDPEFQKEALKAWHELGESAKCTGLVSDPKMLRTPAVNLECTDTVTDGETLFAADNFVAAVEVFAAVLKREPNDSLTRGNMACAYWELGQHNRALVEIVLAHCNAPDDENIALNLHDMLGVASSSY